LHRKFSNSTSPACVWLAYRRSEANPSRHLRPPPSDDTPTGTIPVVAAILGDGLAHSGTDRNNTQWQQQRLDALHRALQQPIEHRATKGVPWLREFPASKDFFGACRARRWDLSREPKGAKFCGGGSMRERVPRRALSLATPAGENPAPDPPRRISAVAGT